jgi:hypothetical protein
VQLQARGWRRFECRTLSVLRLRMFARPGEWQWGCWWCTNGVQKWRGVGTDVDWRGDWCCEQQERGIAAFAAPPALPSLRASSLRAVDEVDGVQVLNVEEEVECAPELVKHPCFCLQRVQTGMCEELHFAETCVWAPCYMHM